MFIKFVFSKVDTGIPRIYDPVLNLKKSGISTRSKSMGGGGLTF